MTVKFGKLAARHDDRTLSFAKYVTDELPAPPAAYSSLERVDEAMNGAARIPEFFPMDGNDRYGCCTIAAAAHAITLDKLLVGGHLIASERTVVDEYLRLTGGEDTGLNELDVLNYWRKHSLGGQHILAYVKLDPHNHTHVEQAIEVFGGVYLGFQVQENAESDFGAGRTWTPGKLTNDGHAVYACAYDPETVTVLTWGAVQKGTWAWWDECVDEAYAILPIDARTAGFAPGIDLDQLEADLQEVAS